MTEQSEIVRGRAKSRAMGLMIVATAVVLAAGFWIWREYFQTYHLATVQEGVLYRDGMRSMREFQTAVADARPLLVVSLVDGAEAQQEPFSQEMEFCRRSKIHFLSIPIAAG